MTASVQRSVGAVLLLFLTMSFSSGDEAKSTQLPASEEAAAKALKALGGRVIQDKAAEGKPVIGVDLSGQQVMDEDLKKLKDLKNLKALYLIQTPVSDTSLKELKELKNLRELRLDATPVTDAGLKELKDLKELQVLGLSGTQVTNAGLKELKDLKNLHELRLGGTLVTDDGLKELKGLKELQALGLAGTQVTDAGLREIKGLKALRELRVDGTKITDAGLKDLQQLKELRLLNVDKTKVTNAGMDDLQQTLPELKITPVRLKGEVKTIDFESKNLGTTRGVKVYLPPGHDKTKRYPVIYAADGFDGIDPATIEALIIAGKVPPLIMVGTENSQNRFQEYVPGADQEIFDAHEKFFIEEVLPWAEKEWGASREKKNRVVYGSSNSGPFALTMSSKHPDLFGNVFAMMVYGLPFGDFESELKEQPKEPTRYILVVGSRDGHGIEENRRVEEILKKKKFPVSSSIIKGGGHSHELQKEQLPGCVEATFGKK